MAKGRTMQAVISLAGKIDPSLAKAVQSAEKQVSGLQRSLSKVGSTMATGLAAVGGAAVAAVGAVGTAALSSYADYEQLVGGVETLFKDSAGTVQQYAAQAYQTAGVSANTYMEQATAFSASLIQSLGGDTQAAASYADQAIRDMSDRPMQSRNCIVRLKRIEPCQGCMAVSGHANGETLKAA